MPAGACRGAPSRCPAWMSPCRSCRRCPSCCPTGCRPTQHRYWRGTSTRPSREMVRAAPDRFHGLGMVPLQDMDAAQRELEHAMRQLGLEGVEIATNVNGVALGHPSLEPFFAAAESLGAAIFVHPLRPAGMDRLVWSGEPRAGRGLPLRDGARHRLGDHRRTDEAPSSACASASAMAAAPSARYCRACSTPGRRWRRSRPPWRSRARRRRKLFYDTLVYDETALRFLIDSYGASQLMIGSDYPSRSWTASRRGAPATSAYRMPRSTAIAVQQRPAFPEPRLSGHQSET